MSIEHEFCKFFFDVSTFLKIQLPSSNRPCFERRVRKTRRYINVVCCVLEIPPLRVSRARVWCVQGRTLVVAYRPCFERQIPQDEVLYKCHLLRTGDPTLER